MFFDTGRRTFWPIWLLATGSSMIELSLSFSISCQKLKARGQKPPSSQVIVPQHRVPNLITSRLSWLLLRWPVWCLVVTSTSTTSNWDSNQEPHQNAIRKVDYTEIWRGETYGRPSALYSGNGSILYHRPKWTWLKKRSHHGKVMARLCWGSKRP